MYRSTYSIVGVGYVRNIEQGEYTERRGIAYDISWRIFLPHSFFSDDFRRPNLENYINELHQFSYRLWSEESMDTIEKDKHN